MPRFFEIEQCPAENVRIYRVQGLRLYDEPEERNHGPVIELVRSLPGVFQATFKDCHTFVVKRSLGVTWQDAEPQIVELLQGVAACSDVFSSREQEAEVAVP
jgi:hypothetical protein